MSNPKEIHIIGGGIIGLCSAYYLQKAGYLVTIIDKSDLGEGCSHGNAGMIVPSHFMPLASPGVIAKGISWMFSSKSPFYIKPRLNLELLQWLWQFYRASNPTKAKEAMPLLRDYNLLSKECYQHLVKDIQGEFAFQEEGLMMLYRSPKGGKEEIKMAEQANQLGVEAKVLEGDQLKKVENGTELSALGGVFYPGDAHLYPNKLMQCLRQHLGENGAKFIASCTVRGFDLDGKNQILGIETNQGRIETRKVVLATGSWTAKLARKLGLKLLIQDGKGYSVTIKNTDERPRIPSILVEDKVAVTPMGKDLRIGGTLEISGMRDKINPKKVKGVLEAMPKYFPKIQPQMPSLEEVWSGFRPCTPDGLPYLGYSSNIPNLVVACGHAMLGLSLGPATGKIVSELILGQNTSLSLKSLTPERFQ